MATADAQLLIQLVDRATASMQKIAQNIDRVEQKISTSNKKMAAVASQTSKSSVWSLDRMQKKIESMEGSFRSLRNKWVVALSALSAGIITSTKQAGNFEQLKESYERMTNDIGVSSEALLEKLREVSQGTISDQDLILASNRAMTLGVAKSMDEFVELMEVARLKWRDMGLSTSQAFNDIVTGIGRSSPLILDNLGIVVKAAEAQEFYAQSLGKATTELTENEKRESLKIAVLARGNQEVAEAGVLTVSAAERYQQLNAQLRNTVVTIGSALIPVVDRFLQAITPVIDRVAVWVSENEELFAKLVVSVAAFAWLATVIGTVWLALKPLIGAFQMMGTVLTVLKWTFAALSSVMAVVKVAFAGLTLTAGIWIAAIAAVSAAVFLLIKHWDEVKAFFGRTWEKITGFFETHKERIIQIVRVLWRTMVALMTGGLSEVVLIVHKNWDEIAASVHDLGKRITTWFENIFGPLIEGAMQWWRNLMDMFAEWIRRGMNNVVEAVRKLVARLKAFLWFSSPTEEWPWATADRWAPNFVQMFADGLLHEWVRLETSARFLAGKVQDAFAGVWTGIGFSLPSMNIPSLEGMVNYGASVSDPMLWMMSGGLQRWWSNGGVVINFSPTIYWAEEQYVDQLADKMVGRFKEHFDFESYK